MAKALTLNKQLWTDHSESLFVWGLVILAFVIRTWRLNTDLLFHIDQGLHALGSWGIWHDHHLTLLGHPTDVDGIFHGPLYYFLMAIPYFFSGGNPAMASLFQIALEVLSLPFFFLAIKRIFNPEVALISLVFYTFSFGLIGYSRWLSNVTPIWPLVNLFLYQIVRKRRETWSNFFMDGLLVGLICQFNGAVGVGLIPFLVWFEWRLLRKGQIFWPLFGLLLPAIPQLIFEFRHHFIITQAIINFTSHSKGGVGLPILPFVTNIEVLLEQLAHIVTFPFSVVSAFLFGLGLWQIRHNQFRTLLVVYLLSPLLTFALFKRGAIGFFLVPILPLSLAIVTWGIYGLGKLKSIVVVLVLMINLFYLPLLLYPNNALVPIGNANLITLQDRLNILDWTYQHTQGKPFAVWIYTIPYFQDEPWTYLFSWYGQKKYGYLPEKTGGFSPRDLKTAQYFFDFYEPDHDQSYRLSEWQKEVTSNFGAVVDRFHSHDVYVELRAWKN